MKLDSTANNRDSEEIHRLLNEHERAVGRRVSQRQKRIFRCISRYIYKRNTPQNPIQKIHFNTYHEQALFAVQSYFSTWHRGIALKRYRNYVTRAQKTLFGRVEFKEYYRRAPRKFNLNHENTYKHAM